MLELTSQEKENLYMLVPIEQVFCLKSFKGIDGDMRYQVLWLNGERTTTEIDEKSFLDSCERMEKFYK